MTLFLDPFQDRRIGVQFQVNAAGVQADAAYSEADGSDYSYDQVWDSEGRINKQGWMAMIVLPFRSVRFREARQHWGVMFNRLRPCRPSILHMESVPGSSSDACWRM